MANTSILSGLDVPQLQSLAQLLAPHLQQQMPSYTQSIVDALADKTRQIVQEELERFSTKLQGSSHSHSPPPSYTSEDVLLSNVEPYTEGDRYVVVHTKCPNVRLEIAKMRFQGSIWRNLLPHPSAMIRQALSPHDIAQAHKQPDPIRTYLAALEFPTCNTVIKLRNASRASRAMQTFTKLIRSLNKTFGHCIEDAATRDLLKHPATTRMIAFAIERECALFGPTPIEIDRARLYITRIERMTRYIRGLSTNEEGAGELLEMLRAALYPRTGTRGALVRRPHNLPVGFLLSHIKILQGSQHSITSSSGVRLAIEGPQAPAKGASDIAAKSPEANPAPLTAAPVVSYLIGLQSSAPVQAPQLTPVPQPGVSQDEDAEMVLDAPIAFEAGLQNPATVSSLVSPSTPSNLTPLHSSPALMALKSTKAEGSKRPGIATKSDTHSDDGHIKSTPMVGVESTVTPSQMNGIEPTPTSSKPTSKPVVDASSPHLYNNKLMMDVPVHQSSMVKPLAAPTTLSWFDQERAHMQKAPPTKLDRSTDKSSPATSTRSVTQTSTASPATTSETVRVSTPHGVSGKQQNHDTARQAQTPMSSSNQALPNTISSSQPTLPNTIATAASQTPDATSTAGADPKETELLGILTKARQKLMNNKGFATHIAETKLQWSNPNVVETVMAFLVKNEAWGNGSIDQAISMASLCVEEDSLMSKVISSLKLIWDCVNHWHLRKVKIDDPDRSGRKGVGPGTRIREAREFFSALAKINKQLLDEQNPSGCMTWWEMKELVRTKEHAFFTSNRPLPQIRPEYYKVYMGQQKEWVSRAVVLQFIANRGGSQAPVAVQNINAPPPTISSRPSTARKRKNDEAKNDDDASMAQEYAKRMRDLPVKNPPQAIAGAKRRTDGADSGEEVGKTKRTRDE